MTNTEENTKRIFEIKKQLGEDMLILAHHYQRDEIIQFADAVGDSLKLAQIAEKNKRAKYIVFCGVHFMAETADILTEDWQKVLLPALDAGCPMADMADRAQAEICWDIITKEFGESIVPITYINSKAEVKAFVGLHDGTTVTSGNAKKVLSWGLGYKDRVLFLPDQNLGRNTAVELGIPVENMALYDPHKQSLEYSCPKEDVKMILWDGFCCLHNDITTDHVEKARAAVPDAKVIVHPECRHEIVKISDGSGSTEYLIKAVKAGESGSKWVVGTESNLVERIKRENPDKSVYLLDPHSICKNMNKTNTANLLDTLEGILKGDFSKQIVVDRETAENSIKSLNTMLSLS